MIINEEEQMRKIRFRAWFKPLKRMYIVRELRFERDGDIIVITNHTGGTAPNSYEIMQFTGLKDKNGKEIFEGDIVKCFKRDSELNRSTGYEWISGEGIALIKNDGWMFYYKIIKQPTESEFFFNGPEGEEFYVSNFNGNTIEVIGNIYENPELLEEKC